MSLADELKNEVLSVLSEYGRTVTLTVNNEGDYDRLTGTVSGDNETDYSVTGLLLGYRDRDIDGNRILAKDRKCILAASGMSVVPTTGDILTVDSIDYTVMNVKIYEINGTTFAYLLQVRDAG